MADQKRNKYAKGARRTLNKRERLAVGSVDTYTNLIGNTNTEAYEHAMEVLMEKAETNDDPKVLDIGCNGSFTVDLLQHKFKDTSSWNVKSMKSCSNQSDESTLHVYPDNLLELIESKTIADNSMDVIILYHVVYYLDTTQLKETLNAIVSWLKHEGVLLMTVIDDDNEFVDSIYKQISPEYTLSRRIEDILTSNKTVQHFKDTDLNSIHLTFKEHLSLLKSMTIRDCLNECYFPDGVGKQQLHHVDNKCIHFIKNELPTVEGEHDEDGLVYENTFKMINFVVKKETKTDAQKRYYAMIGTAIAVFLIAML
eukprot:26306_1